MSEYLHIVCLDAPAPPDYGGAIDMFYKVEALFHSGRKIILHYFDYKGRSINELLPFCTAVYAYKRGSFLSSLLKGIPHIVSSRINRELVDRLNGDDYPILLEGFHCTGILPLIPNGSRKVVIRAHNDEAEYYARLSLTESNSIKRCYSSRESRLLKGYQQGVDKTIPIAALSTKDAEVFTSTYGFRAVSFIPTFLPWQQVTSLEGSGTYCLYHGNLEVSENEAAVIWLVNNVFRHLDVPLYVAGKNPSARLQALLRQQKAVQLITDPTRDELDRLISEAHIHVLPSLNATGVKLKLLHALFCGRFCLANHAGLAGAGLSEGISTAGTPVAYMEKIRQLMAEPFTTHHIRVRQQILRRYDNKLGAASLNALL